MADNPGGRVAARVSLVEAVPPLTSTLPNTRYFEIESRLAGARYAIWVTTPPLYDREPERRYPVLYQPDGNGSAPMTAPRLQLLRADPINPIEPFIQVCVGYAGADARRTLAVRARDLLPPGEALPEGIENSMAQTVEMGMLDREGADLYLNYLRNPAADRFLSFLTEELHPLFAAGWRVTSEDAGLFGYSYGGLFATYVALSRSPLFKRIGAGSPGILAKTSRIFELYNAEHEAGADHSGRRLHLTVCEREITFPGYYQALVGAGTVEFLALAGAKPLKGLTLTSRIIEFESHATGSAPAWSDYLRACFPAEPGQSPLKTV
jgi:predicted alpha/beta superfamily hydrolase